MPFPAETEEGKEKRRKRPTALEESVSSSESFSYFSKSEKVRKYIFVQVFSRFLSVNICCRSIAIPVSRSLIAEAMKWKEIWEKERGERERERGERGEREREREREREKEQQLE